MARGKRGIDMGDHGAQNFTKPDLGQMSGHRAPQVCVLLLER
jgi:hypothetical protein